MSDIDQEFGIPKEYISCPSCGRTYKQAKTVCQDCEECKSCCHCDPPNLIKARDYIKKLIEEGRL